MKNKIRNKLLGVLLVAMTLFSILFISSVPVQAEELDLWERTGYNYTGVSPQLGYATTHESIPVSKLDGKIVVFCIEAGIYTHSGVTYYSENFIHSKKDILSKIVYYGYTNTSQSHYDYAVTQVMVWEELGDQYVSSTIPNYHQRKAEILAQVSKHDTLPSWHNQSVKVQVGSSLTLDDTNGVFNGMNLTTNPTGIGLTRAGNKMTLTPTATSNNGTISFQKVDGGMVGNSIVYRSQGYQTLVEFHLDSTKQANLNFAVIKLGNARVQKIDEDTGKPLANAIIKFEYNGITKELATDENGIAEIKDIPEGTQVTISEVTAPDGFVNKGEVRTVTIEPNQTIEIRLDNKAQQGLLNLNKTGYQAVSIETLESEYGELASFIYDYRPLAGVTYDIKAMGDIVIGGTTHAKAGDVVATVITDEDGNLLNMPYLYLGKYEAIEISAPDGYIIDPTPIPFEFTYEGQEIELVGESVTAQNDYQRLKLQLHKNEESITGWKGNLPVIEEVPANEKVFGLYTNQEWQIGDSSLLTDSLIEIVTVEDGTAILEDVYLPQGFYYFKELDAGENHTLLDRHYEFEYKAQGHDAIQEITLYEKEETPLLNKLHFNSFSLMKLNEEATLTELEGYSFEYKESKGAIFSLEKEDGAVIQTVTVNAESLATFNYIPVGTFYLKEQKPSSSDYLLSETIYRIESTKDGIQVFDEADELIAEQTVLEEPLFLFEVKNHLIKGTGQLTKTDIATGDPLPNTGVRLLDESMTIIYEGRTNDKGILVLDELPKGNYYFQEFEAPVGYQIDETPIPFEIKEDGEVVKCEMKNKQIPKATLPKTGEDSSIKLYVAEVLVSMGAIALLYNKHRKEKLNSGN